MCFKIDQNHPKIKTAKKDIVCYKLFKDPELTNVTDPKNYFESCHQHFSYKKGTRYDLERTIDSYGGIIEEGFHSYVLPATIANFQAWNKEIIPHDSTKLNGWSEVILIECIIPKGTRYYLNECFDSSTGTKDLATYVSESIIIGTDADQLQPKRSDIIIGFYSKHSLNLI